MALVLYRPENEDARDKVSGFTIALLYRAVIMIKQEAQVPSDGSDNKFRQQ